MQELGQCEKELCTNIAYGRCYWRNPCRIPRRIGGCKKLFCEIHGAQFDNFRKFQCCSDCYDDFAHSRKYRQNCRLVLIVILLLVLVIGAITVAVIVTEDGQGRGGRRRGGNRDVNTAENLTDQEEAWLVLSAELEMTPEISTKWGLKAHEVTNEYRTDTSQDELPRDELDWSDKLHTIAYQRCSEVAKGIIPYGQSNFANLLLQMRAMYEPKYEVASMSEKIAKIVNAG